MTVNKKPLPPASIGKDESTSQKAGSRGVVVYPGDLIQLGASTRIYCLDGPASYERGRVRPAATPAAAPLRQQQQRPVDEEEAPVARVLRDETVPSQFRKEWDRIKALRYKRENLDTESARIRAKADMAELTEGQERQLERNDTRQQQIQTQIEEAEDTLWAKVFGQADRQRARRQKEQNNLHDDDDDEVDDFYDQTTSDDQRESSASEEQTEESLLEQWDALCLQRRTIQQQLQSAHAAVQTARDRLAAAEEKFFAQNDLGITIDAHQRVESKLQSVDGRLDGVEKLMHIVNPKRKLKERTAVVDKPSHQTSSIPSIPSPTSEHTKDPQQSEVTAAQKVVVPPPTMLPPPPKRSKTTPETPPPSFMLPPPPRKRPVPGAVIGPSKQPADEMPTEGRSGASSGSFDTWQAPSDQDGSGRTKLNEKFGGRY